MAFHIIYVTHASEDEARRVSAELLQGRLVACANIFPIQSMYWWQGAMEEGQEWVSLLKTASARLDEVCRAIERIHPYEVPCIMQMKVKANEAYEQWIERETLGAGEG